MPLQSTQHVYGTETSLRVKSCKQLCFYFRCHRVYKFEVFYCYQILTKKVHKLISESPNFSDECAAKFSYKLWLWSGRARRWDRRWSANIGEKYVEYTWQIWKRQCTPGMHQGNRLSKTLKRHCTGDYISKHIISERHLSS